MFREMKVTVALSYRQLKTLIALKKNERLVHKDTTSGENAITVLRENSDPYVISVQGKTFVSVEEDSVSCDMSQVSLVKERVTPVADEAVTPGEGSCDIPRKRRVGRPRKSETTKKTEPEIEAVQTEDKSCRVLRKTIVPSYKALDEESSDSELENLDSPDISKLSRAKTKASCPICGQASSRLFHHVLRLHSRHPDYKTVLDSLNQKTKCSICGKLVCNINAHAKSHGLHRKVECSVCGKYVLDLENHISRMHSKVPRQKQKCLECDKSFMNLPVHMIRAHRQGLRSCEKCSYKSDKYTMKIHMRCVHDNVKNYVCDLCGSTFKTAANLKAHKEVVHEGKRAFPCSVCGKNFTKQYHLVVHSRIHTGEMPFVCSYCGKQFKDKSNLGTHIESVHLKVYRYRCDVCDLNFRRRKALMQHAATYHTSKDYTVVTSNGSISCKQDDLGQAVNFSELSSLADLPDGFAIITIPVTDQQMASTTNSETTDTKTPLSTDAVKARTICCVVSTSCAEDLNLANSEALSVSEENCTASMSSMQPVVSQNTVLLAIDSSANALPHSDDISTNLSLVERGILLGNSGSDSITQNAPLCDQDGSMSVVTANEMECRGKVCENEQAGTLDMVEHLKESSTLVSYSDVGLDSEAAAATFALFQAQDKANGE